MAAWLSLARGSEDIAWHSIWCLDGADFRVYHVVKSHPSTLHNVIKIVYHWLSSRNVLSFLPNPRKVQEQSNIPIVYGTRRSLDQSATSDLQSPPNLRCHCSGFGRSLRVMAGPGWRGACPSKCPCCHSLSQ